MNISATQCMVPGSCLFPGQRHEHVTICVVMHSCGVYRSPSPNCLWGCVVGIRCLHVYCCRYRLHRCQKEKKRMSKKGRYNSLGIDEEIIIHLRVIPCQESPTSLRQADAIAEHLNNSPAARFYTLVPFQLQLNLIVVFALVKLLSP